MPCHVHSRRWPEPAAAAGSADRRRPSYGDGVTRTTPLSDSPAGSLSYAAGPTDVPLLEQTIGANFEQTVAARPDAEALVEVATGRRWTWAELARDVDALARGLMAAGLQRGDRLGVWAPNCAEWTITQYATATVGVVLVNVNPAYRTHELAYAVNQSGLRMLVATSSFKTSDYRAMVAEVEPSAPRSTKLISPSVDLRTMFKGPATSRPLTVAVWFSRRNSNASTLAPTDACQGKPLRAETTTSRAAGVSREIIPVATSRRNFGRVDARHGNPMNVNVTDSH